jgi:hypothetical protein
MGLGVIKLTTGVRILALYSTLLVWNVSIMQRLDRLSKLSQ